MVEMICWSPVYAWLLKQGYPINYSTDNKAWSSVCSWNHRTGKFQHLHHELLYQGY